MDVLRHINSAFDGTLALNAWAGCEGRVAIGDPVELLDAAIDVTGPRWWPLRLTAHAEDEPMVRVGTARASGMANATRRQKQLGPVALRRATAAARDAGF